MASQKYLLEILATLSKSNSEIRNCIESNKIFRNLKCRPKLNQKTRWCSAIMLLLSNKRAYEKGAYDDDFVCPISIQEIETYRILAFNSPPFLRVFPHGSTRLLPHAFIILCHMGN